ncbi:MAG: hypothetical protein AB8B86_01660 [Pseudomonadales bacterium]
MKCTSCKQGELAPAHIDNMLPSNTCTQCGGSLIFLKDYLRWRDLHGDVEGSVAAKQGNTETDEADESRRALICPVSGKLMLKFRISKETDRKIDLSPSINAIWLDKGEWALLKTNGVANHLNEVFTHTWQRKVREANSRDTLDAMYAEDFGEHYGAVKEFKKIVEKLECKPELIAYLVADDPYEA